MPAPDEAGPDPPRLRGARSCINLRRQRTAARQRVGGSPFSRFLQEGFLAKAAISWHVSFWNEVGDFNCDRGGCDIRTLDVRKSQVSNRGGQFNDPIRPTDASGRGEG